MTDLFKKLNVLIRSGLGDLLGDGTSPRRTELRGDRLGREIDAEVAALRQRVNQALAYEDQLKARAAELADEVARLDAQADDAVARGADDAARLAVEQLQRARQRHAMAEADLRDHRRVTQELIERVNMLDAAVADARRAQSGRADASSSPATAPEPLPGRLLSDVLRDAREKINAMADLIAAQEEQAPAPAEPPTPSPADPKAVDDDLAQRRQRLSR